MPNRSLFTVKSWTATLKNLMKIFCLQILAEKPQWQTTKPLPPNFLALKTLLSERRSHIFIPRSQMMWIMLNLDLFVFSRF